MLQNPGSSSHSKTRNVPAGGSASRCRPGTSPLVRGEAFHFPGSVPRCAVPGAGAEPVLLSAGAGRSSRGWWEPPWQSPGCGRCRQLPGLAVSLRRVVRSPCSAGVGSSFLWQLRTNNFCFIFIKPPPILLRLGKICQHRCQFFVVCEVYASKDFCSIIKMN